ncbi:DivIVA domain-containing protein [Amycolatopsis pithecellobii]|nr:DivIVA domain-containing protein [Amycolatopsis pithecellobii]
MSSDEETPTFPTTFRGYDRQEVDEYVRSARVKAERLAAALREAEQRLDELAADPAVPLPSPGSGTMGARVERIVALAESEAREIREQAVEEVAQLRAELEQEADQARRFRDQAAKASAEESRRMVERAEKDVAKLRETRAELLEQLVKIGQTVDLVTERLTEKATPKPRDPAPKPPAAIAEAKARLSKAAAD